MCKSLKMLYCTLLLFGMENYGMVDLDDMFMEIMYCTIQVDITSRLDT